MRTIKQRVEGWVLIHVWIERGPDGEGRIRLKRPTTDQQTVESEVSFTDPEQAFGVLRTWFTDLVRRAQEPEEDGRPDG